MMKSPEMRTFEEQLDEVIALAADAGRLNAEAIATKDSAKRRTALRAATLAEQQLSAARTRFMRARAKDTKDTK